MKDTLAKILELTHYEGDREKWLTEAIGILNLNTFSALVLSLPEEEQKELQEELKNGDAIQNAPRLLSEYFPQDQIEVEYEKQSEVFMSKYVENVFPTLPADQQKAVEDYFNSAAPSA